MDIRKLDKNFIQASVQGVDFDVFEIPDWMLEGFPWEKENRKQFCRLPDAACASLNDDIKALSQMSAGGVLRFCTDSRALLLKGKYRPFDVMAHMPLTGIAGFDIMILEDGRERLLINLKPEARDIIAGRLDFEFSCFLPEGRHEYKVYMPLYAGLEELQIGLAQGASVGKPTPHIIEKPILFYGSSVTQGACASRPSNCHPALVAGWLDAQQINLGFSGYGKGERPIAEAIAGLPLSCLVMAIDYNVSTEEDLRKVHEPFFEVIRSAQPKLPIVITGRPYAKMDTYKGTTERRKIILNTYMNALNKGDKHVYFVDGMRFYDEVGRETGTVDLIHPSDLGFYFIAKAICPVVKEAIKMSEQ